LGIDEDATRAHSMLSPAGLSTATTATTREVRNAAKCSRPQEEGKLRGAVGIDEVKIQLTVEPADFSVLQMIAAGQLRGDAPGNADALLQFRQLGRIGRPATRAVVNDFHAMVIGSIGVHLFKPAGN
jgi:hypothetical protein